MGFWEDILYDPDTIRSEWEERWTRLSAGPVSADYAKLILAALWKRTHLDICRHYQANKDDSYKRLFPTVQGYRNRLVKVENLWWVDHATAGVNGWGTLDWFSSKRRQHSEAYTNKIEAVSRATLKRGSCVEKNGKYIVTWTGLAEAVTHLVVFPDGTPFMLLPLDDGAWGEPKRNGDAIQIEMVNPLVVHRDSEDQMWHFWAGPIPKEMTDHQQPITLDKPFRGARYMMPYTYEQVVTNVKLKRLCYAILGKRMALQRMSQHTDWRESKYDMGPLWPFDLCNKAAFENYPIESYNFVMQVEGLTAKMPPVTDMTEVTVHEQEIIDIKTLPDSDSEDHTLASVRDVQETLVKLYGPAVLPKYGADGDLGAETTAAVERFQKDWNRFRSSDRIKIDGVPGVNTCARLIEALASGNRFPKY
jgi:hypothetical protein